jgi:hypothetical protein
MQPGQDGNADNDTRPLDMMDMFPSLLSIPWMQICKAVAFPTCYGDHAKAMFIEILRKQLCAVEIAPYAGPPNWHGGIRYRIYGRPANPWGGRGCPE